MINDFNKPINEAKKDAVIKTFFDTMKRMGKENPLVTNREIIERAAKSAAPRFFTTYETARRFVSLLIRKKRLPIVNKNKVAMYKEIYNRFMKMSRENIGKYGCYRLLENIIESPAPSFYMDCDTFQGVLYKTLRERSHAPAFVSSINTDIA